VNYLQLNNLQLRGLVHRATERTTFDIRIM